MSTPPVHIIAPNLITIDASFCIEPVVGVERWPADTLGHVRYKNVAHLDGGFKTWEAAGLRYPTSTAIVQKIEYQLLVFNQKV